MPSLVLASTSTYRKQLLERLELAFLTDRPDVDESELPGETPTATAERLALAKARAVANRHPGSLIIGSDQVAYSDMQRFGKPGTAERAIGQLQAMRGKSIFFHTALCLLDTRNGTYQQDAVSTEVRFRALSDAEIQRYVEREQPFDCAGSAKAEALGISLIEYMRGDDPNALIGLPLISLCNMLRTAGVEIL
ncbi:Maf family nucleotide pyrophosphatase [Uliginosibacterium sp. H3]|uniref:7-methyl-GTP pyrophosphatase n=1 Tax=Uliginosibacterium silvisoli TaxID=3114758 RepID=A0ABU6K8Q1_9RHOO|nr:Maf family nucleotide pyrophosphatase [Uliginosibacterium sp. H3]